MHCNRLIESLLAIHSVFVQHYTVNWELGTSVLEPMCPGVEMSTQQSLKFPMAGCTTHIWSALLLRYFFLNMIVLISGQMKWIMDCY